MIFNKSTEYSIKILIFLVDNKPQYLLNAGEIAEAVKLPKEFTSKILQILARNNFVSSRRGNRGGFKIAKSADSIVLGDLIKIFDDSDFLSKCLIGYKNDCMDCSCPMLYDWTKLKINMYGSKITEINRKKFLYT